MKPLFSSMEQALRWAFYESQLRDAQTLKGSSIFRYAAKDSRQQIADDIKREEYEVKRTPRYDLEMRERGYDSAAQAGMIKSYLLRMPIEEGAHMYARYLLGVDRSNGQSIITVSIYRMLSFEFGVVPYLVLAELVARYYGKRVKLKSLVREGVSYYRVSSLNDYVLITLKALSHRAETRAYKAFQEMGVVL